MIATKNRLLILSGVVGIVLLGVTALVHYLNPVNQLVWQLVWEVRTAKEPWDSDRIVYTAFLVKQSNREQAATPALIELLNHDNRIVRSKATRALREVNADPALAVPAFLQALADPAPDVRWHAVIGLGQVRPVQQRVVQALIALRSDEELRVRNEAVRAFKRMGPAAEAAIPMLIDALSEPSILATTLAALGNMGPTAKQATPILLKFAKEAEDYYRCCAAEALWQIEGDPEAVVPLLIEVLKGKDNSARRNAATALAWIGPPAKAAIPALREILEYQPKAPELEVKPPVKPHRIMKGVMVYEFYPVRPMTDHELYPQLREAAARALQCIQGGTD